MTGEVSRQWLERLYGNSPGYFAITPFAGGRPRRTMWVPTSNLDKAVDAIERAAGGKADLYTSVGTHSEKSSTGRGGEDTIVSIPGFWADLDIGEFGHQPASLPNPPDEAAALSIIEGLPEPSMLQHSGGGLQAFWLFDEPWALRTAEEKARAKQASKEWNNQLIEAGKRLGYHVDDVANLDRILRVPGSINHKGGMTRPVALRWADKPAISREDLVPEMSDPATLVAQPDIPAADDFPMTWDQIFLPHGYTKCSDTTYARPGKSCGEGHSVAVTPENPGIVVNFSGTDDRLPEGAGHGLTKAKVYEKLNGHPLPLVPKNWGQPLDWEELLTGELPDPEWLVEPLIERGQQIALYSQPKTGKSLLLLEIVAGLAAGRPVFGNPSRESMSIVYVDEENTRNDIREHLTKMEYKFAELPNLHYYSFPSLAMLDTKEGGQELHAVATYHRADIVVIDTLSRVVEGEENGNDTYHKFYRHSGVPLKADGIALIRLDHGGKDDSRGMRGASAKASDVDAVWHLSTVGKDQLVLTRTHQRMAHGESRVSIARLDDPLRHETGGWIEMADGDRIEDIITQLDLDEVDQVTGWNAVYKSYQDSQPDWSQSQVREAVRRRKSL